MNAIPLQSHLVHVQWRRGIFIARCNGKIATSASDPMVALKKAVLKYKTGMRVAHQNWWEIEKIAITKVTSETFIVEWT